MLTKKFWSTLAIISLILCVGLSAYLTKHHFNLLYGMQSEKSFCSINAQMDCDSVNVSKYSEVFGIPIALFGLFAYGVSFLFLLGGLMLGEDEKAKPLRVFFYISSFNFAYSIFMASISLFVLKTLCLFCACMYVLSLIIFICAVKLTTKPRFNFGQLFKDFRAPATIILLAIIPLGSSFSNAIMRDGISKDLDLIIDRGIYDWSQGKKTDFNLDGAGSVGNPSAPFKVVVFSDFQCPHCKNAAPSLHAFANAHKDQVQLIYQNYPLSSECNSKVPENMHKESCFFAKAALCANEQNAYVKAHDWIFEHQETLSHDLLGILISDIKLDGSKLESCMKNPATDALLKKQVDWGNAAGVEATPSVFANGKLLPYGFLIPVLEKAFKQK